MGVESAKSRDKDYEFANIYSLLAIFSFHFLLDFLSSSTHNEFPYVKERQFICCKNIQTVKNKNRVERQFILN